jgi:hypothetical protein
MNQALYAHMNNRRKRKKKKTVVEIRSMHQGLKECNLGSGCGSDNTALAQQA